MFFKSLLPFLAFLKSEGPSSQPLLMFWHYVFAITSYPKNKEQVCWSSCRWRVVFNYNSCKNYESKKQPFQIYFPIKLADKSISIKKEKLPSYLVHNIVGLKKMDGKTEQFSWKIALNWTCSQIFRKYSYLENLLLSWVMLKKASAHL